MSAGLSYVLRLRAIDKVENDGMVATVSNVTRAFLNSGTASSTHFVAPGQSNMVNVRTTLVQGLTLGMCALAVVLLSIGGFAVFFKHHENQLRQWYMYIDSQQQHVQQEQHVELQIQSGPSELLEQNKQNGGGAKTECEINGGTDGDTNQTVRENDKPYRQKKNSAETECEQRLLVMSHEYTGSTQQE